jgi:nicotinamide mononucleotide transporter
MNFLDAMQRLWTGVSPLELAGAVLGLIYVILAVRENRWCWGFALLSTALYLAVFAQSHLYMQSCLQAYFLLMALYGWVAWNPGAGERPVTASGARSQLLAALAVGVISLVTARILAVETHSADPLLDALTTWASVYATWLQARKVLQNWIWWIVIDAVMVWMCSRQALWLTAGLYLTFTLLAWSGWRGWRSKTACS